MMRERHFVEVRVCEYCGRCFRPVGNEKACKHCQSVNEQHEDERIYIDQLDDGNPPKVCAKCGRLFWAGTRSICMKCMDEAKETRVCAGCGALFIAQNARSKYCPKCFSHQAALRQRGYNAKHRAKLKKGKQ